MNKPNTYYAEFWESRSGRFVIRAKSQAGAERIAKRMVDDRNFDEYDLDWCYGESGLVRVEPTECGAA